MTELQTRDSVQAKPWRMPFFWPIAIGAFAAGWAAMYLLNLLPVLVMVAVPGFMIPAATDYEDTMLWLRIGKTACSLAMIGGGACMIRRGWRLPLLAAACAMVCVAIVWQALMYNYLMTQGVRLSGNFITVVAAPLAEILPPLLIAAGLCLPAVGRDLAAWRGAIIDKSGRTVFVWPIAISAIAIGIAISHALRPLLAIGQSAISDPWKGMGGWGSSSLGVVMQRMGPLVQLTTLLILAGAGYLLLRYRRALLLRLYPLVRIGMVIWIFLAIYGLPLSSMNRSFMVLHHLIYEFQYLLLSIVLLVLTLVGRPGRQVRAWRKNDVVAQTRGFKKW